MHARLIRLRAQIVKEVLCLLRDPKSRVVMIGPPLIQLFVFSFAMTLEVKHIDVALLNHDTGGAAIELVQQIQSSDLVDRVRVAGSELELAEMIDTQQVLAASSSQRPSRATSRGEIAARRRSSSTAARPTPDRSRSATCKRSPATPRRHCDR